MLKSLSMSSDSLPVSGTAYEDIPRQGSRLEGFFASGRSAYRGWNPTHGVLVETAIGQRAKETVEADETLLAEYKALSLDRRVNPLRPGYAPRKQKYESVLPTYSPGELSQLGYTVPSGIDFGTTGKLSIPRFSILAAARTEQDIDAATIASMPDGALSTAATVTGGLAYSLGDPVNLIPFGAGINSAKQSVRAGRAAQVAAGARSGVVAAVPGIVLSDAIAFPQAKKWGEDLGIKEAIIDVIAGSTLGAFFGGVGAAARLHSRKSGAVLQEGTVDAVARLERGEMPDASTATARLSDETSISLREQASLSAKDRDFFITARSRATESIDRLTLALERPTIEIPTGSIITGRAPAIFNVLDGSDYKLGFGSINEARIIQTKLEIELGADIKELPAAVAEPLAIYDISNTRKAVVASMKQADGVTDALVLAQLEVKDSGKTLAIVDADHLVSTDQLPNANDIRYFAMERTDEMVRQGEAGAALARAGEASREVVITDAEYIAGSIARDLEPTTQTNIAASRDRGLDAIRRNLGEEGIEVDNSLSFAFKQQELDDIIRELPMRETPVPEELAALRDLETRLREEGLTPEQIKYLEEGNGTDVLSIAAENKMVNEAEAIFTATECLIQSFTGFMG